MTSSRHPTRLSMCMHTRMGVVISICWFTYIHAHKHTHTHSYIHAPLDVSAGWECPLLQARVAHPPKSLKARIQYPWVSTEHVCVCVCVFRILSGLLGAPQLCAEVPKCAVGESILCMCVRVVSGRSISTHKHNHTRTITHRHTHRHAL
jgi:hypothetical protein